MGILRQGLAACIAMCGLMLPVLLGARAAQAQSFDTPVSHRVLALGNSRYGHIRLTCDYYPTFLVKQLDLGEEGAEWFAIVPARAGHAPLCTRSHSAAEKVIPGKDWCGYYQGAKGDFVFFSACNAYNGGLDFAVYDARTGTRVFQDTALASSAGGLHFGQATGGGIALRYSRVAVFSCTLPREGDTCWSQIEGKLGLEKAALPQCMAYEQQMTGSVIAYPVEVALSASPVMKAVAGEIRCWPPE